MDTMYLKKDCYYLLSVYLYCILLQCISEFRRRCPSQYFNSTTPVTITGATQVLIKSIDENTSTTQPRLYIHIKQEQTMKPSFYTERSRSSVTHTTTYATNVASATTHTTHKQEHLQKWKMVSTM